MARCTQCGREFSGYEGPDRLAFISGSIRGDEYIESYFFCGKCNVYTVEVYHDRFLGDEHIFERGPLAKVEGDGRVALIQQCPEPRNKNCRCPAHCAYFGDSLD